MARPPKTRRRDSKADILKAARIEFAAHGFAGAGTDRIARRARVNKAMLYYHFGSKLELYRSIVQDGLGQLIRELRTATAGTEPPIRKFDAYVAALLRTLAAEQHMVPVMLREVAGGGRHLDSDTLRLLASLVDVVRELVDEGRARGEFRDADPVLTHFLIIGAVMIYVGNAPIRARVRALDPTLPIPLDLDSFAQHLGLVLRRTLCVRPDEN